MGALAHGAPCRSRKKGLSRCSAGMGLMGFRLPSGNDGDNCVLSISLRCATAFGCKDSKYATIAYMYTVHKEWLSILICFSRFLKFGLISKSIIFRFCPILEEISTKLMCVNFFLWFFRTFSHRFKFKIEPMNSKQPPFLG